MPTHQDYPWLHDERAREEQEQRSGRSDRSPPSTGQPASQYPRRNRTGGREWLVVGLTLAAGAFVVAQSGILDDDPAVPADPVAAPSVLAVAPPGAGSVKAPDAVTPAVPSRPRPRVLRGLQSRILDSGAVEVWGRTSLPDGSTIHVSVSAAGQHRLALPSAPAAAGRFYVRGQLPASWQGRRIRVRVRTTG